MERSDNMPEGVFNMGYQYMWENDLMCANDNDLLNECSALYSNHYGKWSGKNPNNLKGNIRLSQARIKELVSQKDTAIYYARKMDTKELVGYAIALRTKVKNYGIISWVTQLVVHKEHRNKGIAKNLLFSIWGLSNDFAWGIVSSNPYAIRALEKATRRRAHPTRIKKNASKLLSVGNDCVTYIDDKTPVQISKDESRVNTQFYVDQSDLENKLFKVITDENPWILGQLDEGWEWFAFTFRDQQQFSLSKSEIDTMLETSEQVAKQAYSRMKMDDNHKWTTHTKDEIDFILNHTSITSNSKILDVGCGHGRHSLELARRGFQVTGMDYVDSNIAIAKQISLNDNIDVKFIAKDCRSINLDSTFDLVLCLYDVVGSFVTEADNLAILNSISKSLKPRGVAFISVMNFEMTTHYAKNHFEFHREPDKLLELAASNTMEKTGNIFDPDFILVDDSTGIVYRREQFKEGSILPVELFVQDKRYTITEISELCERAGLRVEMCRCVSARDWNISLDSIDKHAKEILLKCTKM